MDQDTVAEKNAAVIVGGWAPGQGRREGTIGVLLLGATDAGGLRFVGTGFTDAVLADLFESLAELRQASSPFGEAVPREFARHTRWVAPELWSARSSIAPSLATAGCGIRRGGDCGPDKSPADVGTMYCRSRGQLMSTVDLAAPKMAPKVRQDGAYSAARAASRSR